MFDKRNVKELYEEFQYGNSLAINFRGVYLNFGINEIVVKGTLVKKVELKKVSTIFFGDCPVIEFHKLYDNQNERSGKVYIGYNTDLEQQDIPKGFQIYSTSKNGWHSLAIDEWGEHQKPLKIDTMSYNLPMNVHITSLSREYYYPLSSKNNEERDFTNFTQEDCFKFEMIKGIKEFRNNSKCKENCIPFIFNLYNEPEIRFCSSFDDKHCNTDRCMASTCDYVSWACVGAECVIGCGGVAPGVVAVVFRETE